MPNFEFTITAPATQSARVVVEAATIEEAQAIALTPLFYEDPSCAEFAFDQDNFLDNVYLPDSDDYNVVQVDVPGPSAKALQDFWENSDLVEDGARLVTGDHPQSGALSGIFAGGRLILSNDVRDTYAVIAPHGEHYAVASTRDALVAANPEAGLDPIYESPDVEEAFRAAIHEIGLFLDAGSRPTIG